MKNLRKIRKAKGLTQKQLGALCDLSESSINRIESGQRQPSFETLLKLGEALDCPVDYLLDERETFDEQGNSSGPETSVTLKDPDPDMLALLEDLRTRPDMRMLFKLAHGATEDDLRQAVKIIEALRK